MSDHITLTPLPHERQQHVPGFTVRWKQHPKPDLSQYVPASIRNKVGENYIPKGAAWRTTTTPQTSPAPNAAPTEGTAAPARRSPAPARNASGRGRTGSRASTDPTPGPSEGSNPGRYRGKPLDVQDVAHRYQQGTSVHNLARELRVDGKRIRAALDQAGVPRRPTGRNIRHAQPRPVNETEVRRRYAARETVKSIARSMRVGQSRVSDVLRKHGELRPARVKAKR